jgi:hypothetical protein
MARQDDGSSVKDKVQDIAGNGSKSKEALTAAAVSAVGALAASKGPDHRSRKWRRLPRTSSSSSENYGPS